MAMAAMIRIIATTIISSISEKPFLFTHLIFSPLLSFGTFKVFGRFRDLSAVMFALAAPISLVSKVRTVTTLRQCFQDWGAGGNPPGGGILVAVANFVIGKRTECRFRMGREIFWDRAGYSGRECP